MFSSTCFRATASSGDREFFRLFKFWSVITDNTRWGSALDAKGLAKGLKRRKLVHLFTWAGSCLFAFSQIDQGEKAMTQLRR